MINASFTYLLVKHQYFTHHQLVSKELYKAHSCTAFTYINYLLFQNITYPCLPHGGFLVDPHPSGNSSVASKTLKMCPSPPPHPPTPLGISIDPLLEVWLLFSGTTQYYYF